MNTKKSLFYGTRATVLTVIVVAAVILINFAAVIGVNRFPDARLDLTPEKFFTVSKEAKDYLKSVDTDLKFIVLKQEQAAPQILNEMQNLQGTVQRMAAQNDKIQFELFDLATDMAKSEAFIEKYNANMDLTLVSVVIEKSDTEFQVVTPEIAPSGEYVIFTDFESRIANGINRLLNGDTAQEIEIPDKPVYEPGLRLDYEKQGPVLTLLFLLVFPLIAFIASVIVFVVRRKK